MGNPYVQYYLNQQQGNGMSVFRGSPWQVGYGQTGYGLGGLFRSAARAIMPLVKTGAKTLGKIGLNTGVNLLGDVLEGKNIKKAVKSRLGDAGNVVKRKAVGQLKKTLGQTGNGKKRTTKKKGKKRKKTFITIKPSQVKKRKTSRVEDIFG